MVVIEPIEEETYQYARFDPLTGKWRKPFLVGDPHEWSDAQGIAERKIDSVTSSISERWEWQGSWTVCMNVFCVHVVPPRVRAIGGMETNILDLLFSCKPTAGYRIPVMVIPRKDWKRWMIP